MTPQLKMSRAITKLLYNFPFWGALAIGTEFIETTDVKTMSTNGKWIKWSPEFVTRITEEECMGVVAHEVMHIIQKHMLRRGYRDGKKWNHAADHAINLILLESGFKLPPEGLMDPQYKNMSAEKIYDLLPETPNMPAWGDFTDADPAEASGLEVEIEARLMSAISMAKSRGKVPGFVNGMLQDMEDAQVDWQDRVRRFVTGDQPDDYTFRRPERKAFYHLGIVAPSLECKGAGHIVIGVDTSGSVSDKELKHFLGEINAISTELHPLSITVISCDTRVNSVDTYEAGEEVTVLRTNGRGGTAVRPVFDYIRKHDLPVDHMIYLSDMEVGDWPTSVDFPLLWVATTRNKAPIGETVRIIVK